MKIGSKIRIMIVEFPKKVASVMSYLNEGASVGKNVGFNDEGKIEGLKVEAVG